MSDAAGSNQPPVRFPGLTGLRFVAAFGVFIHHVELTKEQAGLPNWASFALSQWLGIYGVTCFFVLSGFLITYLLLEEQRRTDTIRIGRFYLRRILRIWPLYFAIVFGTPVAGYLSGLAGGPQAHFAPGEYALYLFFAANAAWVLFGVPVFIGPLWSVAVEEQFYLFWPVLVRLSARRVALAVSAFLVFWVGLRVAIAFSSEPATEAEWIARGVFRTLRLECMAVGGLAACALHAGRDRVLRFVHRRVTQWSVLAMISIGALNGLHFGPLDNLIWGLLFSAVILELAANPTPLFSLEQPWLVALGRISYGLYVFQTFAIVATLLLAHRMGLEGVLLQLFLYLGAFALTTIAAALSYRFFESPFLEMKSRFAVVPSGRPGGG